MDAVDLQPGGLVTFRWMQQIVDMIPVSPAAAPELTPTDEPTPFDPPPASEPEPVQTSLTGGQMYPGETLSDYAPRLDPAPDPAGDAPIDEDADDLPF